MTQEQLLNLQKQLSIKLGRKIDIYHSEEHRGVLAVEHNRPLTPFNVVYQLSY